MFSDISHLHVSILKPIVTLPFSKPQTRKLNALPANNLYLALPHCAPTGKGFKPITGILASVVKWFPSRWVWPQTIWCCHHCPLSLPKRWCLPDVPPVRSARHTGIVCAKETVTDHQARLAALQAIPKCGLKGGQSTKPVMIAVYGCKCRREVETEGSERPKGLRLKIPPSQALVNCCVCLLRCAMECLQRWTMNLLSGILAPVRMAVRF